MLHQLFYTCCNYWLFLNTLCWKVLFPHLESLQHVSTVKLNAEFTRDESKCF